MSWTSPKTWAVGSPGTSSDLNQYVRDNTAALWGDLSWTPPPLYQGTWTNGSTPAASFRRVGSMVKLRGRVVGGGPGTIVFTLPVGYTPSSTVVLTVDASGGYGNLTIDGSGNVTPNGYGGTPGVYLDGAMFSVV